MNATQPLKILVVEDSEFHQEAARQQLAGHDLTIAKDYAEAHKLLRGRIYAENPSFPQWGIVLVDLMLPASMCGVHGGGESFEGEQMPLGTILAFMALRNGTKKVAVITDTNHHHHPASAALDNFGGRKSFTVGDAKVFITSYLRGQGNTLGEKLTKEQEQEKPWLAACRLLME